MLKTLFLFGIGLMLFIGVACLYISLFRRRFEECAPLAVCSVFLVTYVLVLLGGIRLAVPAVALAAAAGAALLLFGIFRKKNPDKGALVRLFTPGLAAFVLVPACICVLVTATVESVYAWDEYSHWIIAVKELWLVDAGEAAFRTVVSMPYYPPFTAIIDFLFLKLTGGYSEPMCYAANAVISVSLLIPILRSFPWKKWVQALFCAAALCLMPLVFFVDAIATLYVDCLMGLLIGYILFAYFAAPRKDWFTWLTVSAGICMLSMIKNVGVELCLVPLAIIGADWLFVQRASPSVRRTKRGRALLLAACACAMFLPHGIWHAFLRASGIGSDLVGGTATAARFASFPQAYQLAGVKAAFARLFADRVTGQFTLSIASIGAILLLLGLLLIRRARGSRDERSVCFFVGGTVIGLFAYIAEITLAMVMTFEPAQVIEMLSLERYVDTYLLAMLLAFCGMLLERRKEPDGLLCTLAVLAALVPFTAPTRSLDFMDAEMREARSERRARYTDAVAALSPLDPHADRICYIDQANTKFGLYYLRYTLAPMEIAFFGGWNIGEPNEEFDISRRMVAEDDWAQMVLESGCNYVFIHNTDDYFIEHFAQFFAHRDDIAIDTLYHITEPAAGRLLLVPAA